MPDPVPATLIRSPRRRWAVALLVALLAAVASVDIALLGVASPGRTGDQAAAEPMAPSAARVQPWIGLLDPQDDQLTTLAAGHQVTDLTVAASWQQLEPTQGALDPRAVTALTNRIVKLHSMGFHIELDLGLQYTPSWVFGLPGQTRFVDQYGDVWRGGISEDVPNAVYNDHVRAAEGAFIARLGAKLTSMPLSRIRIGGLLSGELRYPPASYSGHSDLIWNYDPFAQLRSPLPGWRPGVGTKADARTALTYYFTSLTNYLVWQMKTVRAAFPTRRQSVLFPSWGLRPGMVDDAINAGLRNTTNAEVNGMLSSGLDWSGQVAAIARTGIPTYLSCTWIDAPSQGPSIKQVPPIAYLASLAARYDLGLTAENTGGGGSKALALTMQRVRQYNVLGLMYMGGRYIASGRAGITLAQMSSAAAQARRG